MIDNADVTKLLFEYEMARTKYFEYWLPIYKKMYFKYRLMNDIEAMIDLESNIWKNWQLSKEEKKELWRKIKNENIKK